MSVDIESMHARNGRLVKENGSVVNEGDVVEHFGRTMSVLNELQVTERTPIFSLSSTYPLSLFRDVTSGTVTHDVDQYIIEPSGRLESAEQLRYTPGYSAEIGQGVRLDSGAEGQWGAFSLDLDDGFFWRYSVANGLEVGIIRDGVETSTLVQANFDDPLDGTGASGITFDPTAGYTFHINFTYYGYGPVIFSMMKNSGSTNESRMWPVAVLSIPSGTSTRKPNVILVQRNTGASGNLYVTGRQASIVGKFLPSERLTGATSNSVSVNTSWTPLISVRRRNGGGDYDHFSFATESLHIVNGSSLIEFQLLLNPSLTGAVPFTAPNRSSGETAIEFDISATAFSGGEQFFSDILAGSGNNSTKIEDESQSAIRVPRNYWATLVARTFSGTSSVRANMRVLEEW